MNTPTQLHLIYQLNEIRNNIDQNTKKDIILSMAQVAYDIAFPVSVDPAFRYKVEGKEKVLQLLAHEIKSYEKSNSEIEVIRFQLASTILMLMLQFIEGSLENMQEVLAQYEQVKVA